MVFDLSVFIQAHLIDPHIRIGFDHFPPFLLFQMLFNIKDICLLLEFMSLHYFFLALTLERHADSFLSIIFNRRTFVYFTVHYFVKNLILLADLMRSINICKFFDNIVGFCDNPFFKEIVLSLILLIFNWL
jgi:hypothetical protein